MPAATDGINRRNERAILFVLASSASFSVAAALVKAVAADIPTVEVMLFRSVFALPVLMPMARPAGLLASLRTRDPGGHLIRSLTGFFGMFGSFYGFATLPLATVTALGFAMPIFLAILSLPLLGERLTGSKIASIAAGLIGVLIVLRPWQQDGAVELRPALVVIGGVATWALAMVSIRRLGRSGERNVTIVLWYTLFTAVVAGALSIPVWSTPDWRSLLALVGVGVISGAAQMLMTEGYRSGEATVLAPFEYGAIVYSILLGWVIWHEVPGVWEATGIAVLIVAGLMSWWRERRRNPIAAAKLPPSPLTGSPPPMRPAPVRRPD